MTALTQERAELLTAEIYRGATPVLHIYGIGGQRWHRNVPPDDARFGPWLQGRYRILDNALWSKLAPCVYMVAAAREQQIRYVGMSRNRMRDRWRESPAIDHETGKQIEHQLFHSQCWRQIEAEFARKGPSEYEVRCLSGAQIGEVLNRLGAPLSQLAVLNDAAESQAAAVERWMCSHSSPTLVPWNVAMASDKRGER